MPEKRPGNIHNDPVFNDTTSGEYRLVESLLHFSPADLNRYHAQGWRVISILTKSTYWYLYLERKDEG